MMKAKLYLAAAAALLALAACGGGGGSDTPIVDDSTVPASALESPESFSRWVGDRPASEDKEPLLMMGVLPPTSDSAEPIDIN
jgi:ABC-type glycerol-3-phosphate transport system substrate-binding protein